MFVVFQGIITPDLIKVGLVVQVPNHDVDTDRHRSFLYEIKNVVFVVRRLKPDLRRRKRG